MEGSWNGDNEVNQLSEFNQSAVKYENALLKELDK